MKIMHGQGGSPIKSPLRYPGGKGRAVAEIIRHFPKNIDRVCSPFLGGGSVELELARQGVEVFGYDDFEPLVNFWLCLMENPGKLTRIVRKLYPMSRSTFLRLQKMFSGIRGRYARAAVFYAINRASFSGTTLSGGWVTPKHTRFTPSSIDYLSGFRIDRLHVGRESFESSIERHKDDFLYLDPPYFIKSKIYGVKGNKHRGFNHEKLAEMLAKRRNWILSYNDCPEVRRLYKGFRTVVPHWPYGMNANRPSNELLIFSRDVN
jgi:DNA adenine methylase